MGYSNPSFLEISAEVRTQTSGQTLKKLVDHYFPGQQSTNEEEMNQPEGRLSGIVDGDWWILVTEEKIVWTFDTFFP